MKRSDYRFQEVQMERVPRRHYTDDFKSQAIALAGTLGRAQAARQLSISIKTLANWLDRGRGHEPPRLASRQPVSEVESELTRLRAENAALRMERDILKKATAFFARESK